MLYLIGTGLYYLDDMPLRAIDILKQCDSIYIERYTNLNNISFLNDLKKMIGKDIFEIKRSDVESDLLLEEAKKGRIALLIPGDPLSATTHISLLMDCKSQKIDYSVVHASSIFTAAAECGLSMYRFGAVTSVPIYTENYKPESFFDVIQRNLENDMHSLVLLEVQDGEKFVSLEAALKTIKEIEARRGLKMIDWGAVVCMSRMGSKEQRITFAEKTKESVKPPISLVIPAKLNDNEKEALSLLIG